MAKSAAKRSRKLRVKGLAQPRGQSPWVEYMDFDIPDMSDQVFYESDERVHDSMVRQLVKKRVVKLEGFDDVIDKPGGGSIASATPVRLMDGHLLVAFTGNHALILVLPESQGFLENQECFTHLVQQQYKEVCPAELFEVHLAFLHPLPEGDETDDQYKILWLEKRANGINPLTLAHYHRLFYVCDLSGIVYADLKKIAISVMPEFYSSFYSDCLQYCKDFCKKFFQFSLMNITGEMINRVDALAITGTRVETTSRKNLSSAVLGNRALDSYLRPSSLTVVGVVVLLVVGLVLPPYFLLVAALWKYVSN